MRNMYAWLDVPDPGECLLHVECRTIPDPPGFSPGWLICYNRVVAQFLTIAYVLVPLVR